MSSYLSAKMPGSMVGAGKQLLTFIDKVYYLPCIVEDTSK